MAILDGLNDRQKEAVLAKNGPLLIIAGAGSGKTKTIAHRIAYLISTGISPDKILAVTFTNRAAGEMKERIYGLLNEEGLEIRESKGMFIGTFHALGVSILRRDGHHIGIPAHFSILDEEDSRKVVKDIIREYELDPESYPAQRIRATISRLKNDLIDPSIFAESGDDNSPYQKTLAGIYAAYEAKLQKSKCADFDDLLLKTVMVLEQSKEARAFYEDRWEYIHIDEYQDTNGAQYAISRILSAKYGNIAVVGDVDQAIYSWRGADWRNILQFEHDWHGTKVILLEENYRSCKIILEAANAVIAKNRARKEKNLWSGRERGDEIQISLLEDERCEALFIASAVKKFKDSRIHAKDIAVLFRTNAQSRAIEEAFLKENIAYRLFSGVKFYERKEVKDVLAYLRSALNSDDIVAKKRIINTPPRTIGKALMVKYVGLAQLSGKDAEKIKKFESLLKTITKNIFTKKASLAMKFVLKEAGFEKYYKGDRHEQDRWENIEELLSVAKKFDGEKPPAGIERLLTEASLATSDTEVEPSGEEVTLLTAHAAKGLEFKIVIIAGMEERLFPHALSQSEQELEEERRLFYVALTRAKDKIIVTLTKKRMIYGDVSFNEPSRFLGELPENTYTSSIPKNKYEEDEITIF